MIPATALSIAKTDFAQTVRSRFLWGAVVLVSALAVLDWFQTANALGTINDPWSLLLNFFQFFTALIAIGLGYAAVVGDRSSGRARLLLGSGGSRADLLVGKFCSRFVVLVLALAVPYAIVSGIVLATEETSVANFVGATVGLLAYAGTWLGLVVGISAMVSTEARALGIAGGLFAVFVFFWDWVILPAVAYVLTGSTDLGVEYTAELTTVSEPTWLVYAVRASPFHAFEGLSWYLPTTFESIVGGDGVGVLWDPNMVGFVTFAAFAGVALVGGYLRFRRVDF